MPLRIVLQVLPRSNVLVRRTILQSSRLGRQFGIPLRTPDATDGIVRQGGVPVRGVQESLEAFLLVQADQLFRLLHAGRRLGRPVTQAGL